MRITNNMIMNSSKSNVGGVKGLVDKYNTQMTTQKKINKASENPVIAIRSLRMSTSMTHIDQFKENNIPDAEAWLDVTHTALTNMKSILTDVRTQCVKGSTDSLTADDRSTILKQLTSLVDQVYAEGNSDYAGRTVFTGYRTSSDLTFLNDTDANAAAYKITQNFDRTALEEHRLRYYKSQPWGVDGNVLMGFFCDVDGNDTIHIDETELSMADWYERDALPARDDGISLTREMIRVFEEGNEPK